MHGKFAQVCQKRRIIWQKRPTIPQESPNCPKLALQLTFGVRGCVWVCVHMRVLCALGLVCHSTRSPCVCGCVWVCVHMREFVQVCHVYPLVHISLPVNLSCQCVRAGAPRTQTATRSSHSLTDSPTPLHSHADDSRWHAVLYGTGAAVQGKVQHKV